MFFICSATGNIVSDEVTLNKNHILLESDGYVQWTTSQRFDTHCRIDPYLFPFDTQTCTLVVSGWITTSSYVNFSKSMDDMDREDLYPSNEWSLELTRVYDNQSVRNDGVFSDVVFEFTWRRRSTYYVLTIIMPLLLVSLLGLFIFPLPPESGEKISLGMTCFLSFSVTQAAIDEHLPTSTRTMPLIRNVLHLLIS